MMVDRKELKAIREKFDAQLEIIASVLKEHYVELVRFLEKKNFIQVKNELELF